MAIYIWIILFDSTTPDIYKKKIELYQSDCPQQVPVYVEPQNGRYFAELFRREVVKRLNGDRIITTYLDNDDALNLRFVEDIPRRIDNLCDGTFFYYTHGYQLFTDYNYILRVYDHRNHFVSVIERGDAIGVKTIYGYGSHYYIDKIKNAKIEYIREHPMWCEIIHDRNMGNDAYFLLGVKMVKDKATLFVGVFRLIQKTILV